MKHLCLILLFISCESSVKNKSGSGENAEKDSPEGVYASMQLQDTYNFNGHDYSARELTADEMLAYNNAYSVFELTRDDNLERILIKNKSYPVRSKELDSQFYWHSDLPDVPTYKSLGGFITYELDGFTICRDEINDDDPFDIYSYEVCDEFTSI